MAQSNQTRFYGSTSTLTTALSQLYFLVSGKFGSGRTVARELTPIIRRRSPRGHCYVEQIVKRTSRCGGDNPCSMLMGNRRSIPRSHLLREPDFPQLWSCELCPRERTLSIMTRLGIPTRTCYPIL